MIESAISRPGMGRAVCALAALALLGCAYMRTTPLCEAIVAGDVEGAMQLVERGADVDARSGCALLAAAERGEVELVKLLLEHGADPNRFVAGDQAVIMGASTPLEAAVLSGEVAMVQLLLDGGADPQNDFQAFAVVLNFGSIEMADVLLRYGADPNMASAAGRSVYAYEERTPAHVQQVIVPPRELAADRIEATAQRYRCNMSGPESLLYAAIQPGSPGTGGGRDSIVAMLLGRGADPNWRTLTGTSPLMFAASQHNHHVMTRLLQAGADAAAADLCGRTAEAYADLYPQHPRADLAPQTKALLQFPRRE